MPKGKPYSAEFKARVVLEALQGAKTVNELAAEHGLNPNLVRNWKAKAESGLSRVFSATEDERARERELAEHRGRSMTSIARSASSQPSATIFNGACLSATASTSRTSLVDPANAEVTVARQLELLHIPRSSYYYKPRKRRRSLEGDDRELAMRVVDEVHLEMPYAGCRKIREELRRRTEGAVDASRRCVAGLMEEMDVRPVYPKPNLSKPAKKALRHPYLLKNKAILFPNQVWSIDITYVPIGRTHMYLTCVIDWYSRLVVAWRLADGMGAAGVCACVEEALAAHGTPAILNSDQGSVFNSAAYEGLLAGNSVRQSMDGKARWVDNVIVERWFRSLKTECVRISEYETPAELRRLISAYVEQYNNAHPHQSLGYDTPAEWYYSGLMAA